MNEFSPRIYNQTTEVDMEKELASIAECYDGNPQEIVVWVDNDGKKCRVAVLVSSEDAWAAEHVADMLTRHF